jgi:hypothetical protein
MIAPVFKLMMEHKIRFHHPIVVRTKGDFGFGIHPKNILRLVKLTSPKNATSCEVQYRLQHYHGKNCSWKTSDSKHLADMIYNYFLSWSFSTSCD